MDSVCVWPWKYSFYDQDTPQPPIPYKQSKSLELLFELPLLRSPLFGFDYYSSACLKSSSKSSTASMPTEILIKPSLIPRARLSCGSNPACDDFAGKVIKFSTPPRLAA